MPSDDNPSRLHTFGPGTATIETDSGETVTVPLTAGTVEYTAPGEVADGETIDFARIPPMTLTVTDIQWHPLALALIRAPRNPDLPILRMWWTRQGRRWKGTRIGAVREAWRREVWWPAYVRASIAAMESVAEAARRAGEAHAAILGLSASTDPAEA